MRVARTVSRSATRASRRHPDPDLRPGRRRLPRARVRDLRLRRAGLLRRAQAARRARPRAGRRGRRGRRRGRRGVRVGRPRRDPPPRALRRVPPLPRAGTRRCASASAPRALDPGGFAEYVRVQARARRRAAPARRGSTPCAATCTEPLACALRAQDRAGLRGGDALLVVGAGASGLLQIAAAHARGVDAVWVREPRPDAARARARHSGAERARQRAGRRRDRLHAEARRDRARPRPRSRPAGAVPLRAARAGRRRWRSTAACSLGALGHRQLLGSSRRHARRAGAARTRGAVRVDELITHRFDAQGDRRRARRPAQRGGAEGGRHPVEVHGPGGPGRPNDTADRRLVTRYRHASSRTEPVAREARSRSSEVEASSSLVPTRDRARRFGDIGPQRRPVIYTARACRAAAAPTPLRSAAPRGCRWW